MSIESVREYLKKWNRENDILEFDSSSATVELAAQALHTDPARIAKTLSFITPNGCILIVAAGDARIDNHKFKETFACKAKMPAREECLALTGHAAGGVCPFANPKGVRVYLDVSLCRFDRIFPACGSANSAIALSCQELFEFGNAEKWVDVCKDWPGDISL